MVSFQQLPILNYLKCVSGNFITFFPNIVDSTIENLKIFNNSEHKNDIFFALSHGVGTGKLRKKNTKKEINDPRVIFCKRNNCCKYRHKI